MTGGGEGTSLCSVSCEGVGVEDGFGLSVQAILLVEDELVLQASFLEEEDGVPAQKWTAKLVVVDHLFESISKLLAVLAFVQLLLPNFVLRRNPFFRLLGVGILEPTELVDNFRSVIVIDNAVIAASDWVLGAVHVTKVKSTK